MDLKELQKTWDEFARVDPLWTGISYPGKKSSDVDEFFKTGETDIEFALGKVKSLEMKVPDGRALDFGCGVGRLTQALAGHFDEVYGVDISPSVIEQARKYNGHGDKCKYFLNETSDLGLFHDSSFSFVYSNATLEHMESRYSKEYLGEFLRVLAPGGILVFQMISERERHPTPKKFIGLIRFTGWRVISYMKGRPVSQMHPIKQKEVMKSVQEKGGSVIAVVSDKTPVPGWVSLQYYAKK